MTVAELIEMLKKHPPEMRVFLDHSSGGPIGAKVLVDTKRLVQDTISEPPGVPRDSKYHSYYRSYGSKTETVLFIY